MQPWKISAGLTAALADQPSPRRTPPRVSRAVLARDPRRPWCDRRLHMGLASRAAIWPADPRRMHVTVAVRHLRRRPQCGARRSGPPRRSRRALRPARRGRSRTLRRAEEGRRGRLGVTGGTTARFHTPGGLLRLARRRHAVADAVLGKDVGWRGGVVAELCAELLDDGAHAIGVVRAAAPPHLAQ